ncbi:zinc-dependent metalloprotease [Spirosoma radiotolerans]|uniref:Peptidase n=1 Tax=Spirosoma radiotolerans TaxID=1379870 RepID=A0A0E3V9W8_9BACT|nr:zinc-dependent metalloprotease [Spirosoma radiotolerans]AKD57546.1 peptidase [Spirosoma radiotolerans]
MRKQVLFFYYLLLTIPCLVSAQPTSGTGTAGSISTFTTGMERNPGFMTYYWDAKKGKVWLEIAAFDTEFLYYPTLAQGVGSNDIGLDRGRLGQEHVVKFQRSGPKVLLIEPNYAYRAITNDPLERKAVEESFAKSVHAGFDIVAEENGRVLVDLTPFLLQDAVGAVQAISRTRQGSFKFDPTRSTLYLARTKAFPQNTEFETIITLTGDNPGAYLREVVPTPSAVTMHQHHSFVQLPVLDGSDKSYKPRVFDPRIGYGGIEYFDYATPVNQPIMKRYISRHRLEKKDPSAAVSEAVKPIVYYIDPGTPEPIRSALMEGTAWWNQAFEAAGYKDAFQVKLLPADADPMDIRYNLVQWVHRSTRGWSYGGSISDPRTGEILKGKVTLGSLRVRQDYLIAQGLIGNFAATGQDSSQTDPMMTMSLERLRQLAAHEVGHTLGLPHNYIASTEGSAPGATERFGRASVMDYPTMVAKIKGASIDLSDAYAKGIGAYDKWSIRYGYEQFPKGTNEKQALDKLVNDMHKAGLTFLTDQDARPEGSSHPRTHLWDNGANAVDELKRVMDVRKIALANFTEKKITVGAPMATLEEVFVPMYMFHRYQVEAAAKVLGGQTYTNALRGDGQAVLATVPAEEQNRALGVLLSTLNPGFLAVPQAVLNLIPPRPFRYDPNPREVFKRHTGITFDPLGPPEAAAGMTLRLMLNPERCARLASQRWIVNGQLPSLDQVIDQLITSTYGSPQSYRQTKKDATYDGAIRRMLHRKVLENLMQLAVDKELDGAVRASAHEGIMRIKSQYAVEPTVRLPTRETLNRETSSGATPDYLYWLIGQYETNPSSIPVMAALAPPDGAPIDPGQEWLSPDCDWK